MILTFVVLSFVALLLVALPPDQASSENSNTLSCDSPMWTSSV